MEQLQAVAGGVPDFKALIVDDDVTSRYLISSLLAHSGCEVLEAGGGLEGLRMAREHKPELIILDLGMDDLAGFDVLEQLSREPETSDIHVIIHTSRVLGSEDYARLNRALDIIPKSIMSSREIAEERFLEAFKKAGLCYAKRATNQWIAAE
jgi:CheY-like chemotaxis protein